MVPLIPEGPVNRGFECMFCGSDVWDVSRYVTAGPIVLCDVCVTIFKGALDDSSGDGEVAVGAPPPRVHGHEPKADDAAAVATSFAMTFGSGTDASALANFAEDADELWPLLRDTRNRFGVGAAFYGRVERVRFPGPDLAHVRYRAGMSGGISRMFQGQAVRRGTKWLVTRETVAASLATVGVRVPGRASETG